MTVGSTTSVSPRNGPCIIFPPDLRSKRVVTRPVGRSRDGITRRAAERNNQISMLTLDALIGLDTPHPQGPSWPGAVPMIRRANWRLLRMHASVSGSNILIGRGTVQRRVQGPFGLSRSDGCRHDKSVLHP